MRHGSIHIKGRPLPTNINPTMCGDKPWHYQTTTFRSEATCIRCNTLTHNKETS